MTYQITETREYYGPREETATLVDYFGEPETFASADAAKARIAELEEGRYTTAHNESSRPTYRVKRV